MVRWSLLLLGLASLAAGMEYGGSGVWDSPYARDPWVQRYGFLWGGGRSGMKGLKAMEMRTERSYSAPATNSIINPSGMYGLKVLDNKGKYVPEFPQPASLRPTVRPSARRPARVSVFSLRGVARAAAAPREKTMVRLTPMVGPSYNFDRFMAVP